MVLFHGLVESRQDTEAAGKREREVLGGDMVGLNVLLQEMNKASTMKKNCITVDDFSL